VIGTQGGSLGKAKEESLKREIKVGSLNRREKEKKGRGLHEIKKEKKKG